MYHHVTAKITRKKGDAIVVRDLNNGNVYVITNDTSVEHDDWVIDSINSYHITSNKDCFFTYTFVRSDIVY